MQSLMSEGQQWQNPYTYLTISLIWELGTTGETYDLPYDEHAHTNTRPLAGHGASSMAEAVETA